jgi:hypothetical protein
MTGDERALFRYDKPGARIAATKIRQRILDALG